MAIVSLGSASALAAINPDAIVQYSAQRYIRENANLGGSLMPRCESQLNGVLTIACFGRLKNFAPSEGTVESNFRCIGTFTRDEGGTFVQEGEVRCEEI